MNLSLKVLMSKTFAGALAALVLIGSMGGQAAAGTVSGAGATFPAPIYLRWAAAYKGSSRINYNSIGSGGGIAQIKAKTITFGATDAPLTAAELNQFGLIQFPTVLGGVVPVVNIAGVGPGKLVLDGPTLARIYLGGISSWNDPAIAKLNPGLALPKQAIAVVHRSDGAGTTFIFVNYLAKVSSAWADQVGFGTAVDWPVGIGARGNEGVASNVKQTSGSIGYVEYAYALQNKLAHTKMVNKAGATVEPNAKSFTAAAEDADWNVPGFYVIVTDAPGKDDWPIAGATFILVHKNPNDPAATAEALKFFKWAYESGDAMAASLDYIPMPDAVVQEVIESWSQVKGWGG